MKETNTISMMNFEDFKKVIMKKAEPVAGEGGTVRRNPSVRLCWQS